MAVILNPYAFDFAIRRSCERQSDAFNKSARVEPKVFLSSTADTSQW